MNLDEAIKHCEEVMMENLEKTKDRNASDPIAINCFECAEEHRQLAEWLKELKAYKEQSGDAISRQAVMEHYSTGEIANCHHISRNNLLDFIEQLPSVTPQSKTGHWILADEQNKEDVENDNYRFICSECQCSDIHAKGTKVPYCWKCGAKMVEPQESEVQDD